MVRRNLIGTRPGTRDGAKGSDLRRAIVVALPILIGAAALFFSGVGCGNSGQKSADQDWAQQREEARQEMQTRLDQLNQEIDQLQARLDEEGDKADASLREGVSKLKEQRAEAQKHLDELSKSGQNAWKAAKDGVSESIDDLQKSYKEIKAKLD